LNDARRAVEEPAAVGALPKRRQHGLANGLAGKAVREELLEAVAHFDPHLPIAHGDKDERAIVAAAFADSGRFEELDRVLLDRTERSDGFDSHDHDRVAGLGLERPNARAELGLRAGVNHVGKVVHRFREFGKRLRTKGRVERDDHRESDEERPSGSCDAHRHHCQRSMKAHRSSAARR
jgi:hypothetical protein